MKRAKKWTAFLLTAALALGSSVSVYPQEALEDTAVAQEASAVSSDATQEEEQKEPQKESAGNDKKESESKDNEDPIQPDSEKKTENEANPESEAASENSGETQTEKQTEPVSETQEENQTEPVSESQTETETEAISELETEAAKVDRYDSGARSSELENVKTMIAALPALEAVTASDAQKIQAAWNAYHALSAADQKTLDETMGTNSGQSYGRDLESAYWGLMALQKTDASTTLPKGVYDETSEPALHSEYSKGKSSSSRKVPWSVKSVTVGEDGMAVGVIEVASSSYSYIRTNGQKYACTNSTGNSQFADVPIDLNSTFYIAAYSTSMNGEIAFSITTTIQEASAGEEIPLTGITLSEQTISMYAQEVHDALTVTLEPENTTYGGSILWSSSNSEIVSVDEKSGEISALLPGTAVVTARAGECHAECTVTVSAKAEDGTTHFKVTNTVAMFKVADAYLETKDQKSTLYVTLNGDGYRELFIGSYEQAVATGSDSSKWIIGKQRTDKALLTYTDTDGSVKKEKAAGKWQFAIPVSPDVSYLQVQCLSNAHKKDGYWWYPRQFVIDTKNKTMAVEDYAGTQELEIKNSAKDLEILGARLETVGGPHSNGYQVTAVFELKNTEYSKAYLGKAKEAKKKTSDAMKIKKEKKLRFTVEQIVGTGSGAKIASRLGEPFALSLYAKKQKKWTTFEVTIDRENGVVTVKPFGKDSKDHGNDEFEKVDASRLESNSKTMPGAVDNSTTLADGVYGTDRFRFTYSGGSGRVVLTCEKLEVRDGKAYATITFSRSSKQGGASSYDSVRANGQVYKGSNTFTIPVQLNKNNTIVGRTVSMSAPHWVEYTIFIGIKEPGAQNGQDISEHTTELDAQAPEIMGLTGGHPLETEHTKMLKLFAYDDGYYLIETDTLMNSEFRSSEKYKECLEKSAEPAEENETEPAEDGAFSEEENNAVPEEAEQAESLYTNRILKYLVIPEGAEAPAGLEKEVILIHQNPQKVYVSSESALNFMCELSLQDRIDSIGFEADLPELGEDVVWGGSYDDWELRTLLKRGTELMIESPEILPDDPQTFEADMENYLRLSKRAAQMGAAMFIDRSAEEENEQAKAEWYKVYGLLFDCEEQAQQAYEKGRNE